MLDTDLIHCFKKHRMVSNITAEIWTLGYSKLQDVNTKQSFLEYYTTNIFDYNFKICWF